MKGRKVASVSNGGNRNKPGSGYNNSGDTKGGEESGGNKYSLLEKKYEKLGKKMPENKKATENEGQGQERGLYKKDQEKNFKFASTKSKRMAPMASFVPKKESGTAKWFFSSENLVSTFFGCGYIPLAPGTFGSLAAFPIYFLIEKALASESIVGELAVVFWLALFTFLFFIGSYFSAIYSNKVEDADPSSVVIDEVLGQLIAIVIAGYSAMDMNIKLVLAFALFRFFDITKPLIIGWADEEIEGGYGIMTDDVLAGIAAGLSVIAIGYFM